MTDTRAVRRNAHNAYLAAQRGVATGACSFADLDAARAALHAACDAEHDAAAAAAREARRLDAAARGWAAEVEARRLRRMWGTA